MSSTMPHVLWLVELSPEGKDRRVRLKGVLVQQDGKVRVTSVRNKLTGDVLDMITGFLKNNRMEPSTCRRNYIGEVLARRAWVPLRDREDGIDDA